MVCKSMDAFWRLDGLNVERPGIQLKARLAKLHHGFIIFGEKAGHDIFGARGANGVRVCLGGCNAIKTTRPIPARSSLVPFSEPGITKWEPNAK